MKIFLKFWSSRKTTERMKGALKKSIQKLENKLDRINKARSISPKVPDILIFKD